jgi:hypothetical protein
MASVEQLHATPGVCAAPDASTKDFILQQVRPAMQRMSNLCKISTSDF